MPTETFIEDLQQENAIKEINNNIHVTASAGSGKTRVLTDRFINILKSDEKVNIDQIIAITYTEKAANEMKERILKKILKKISSIKTTENKKALRRWINIKNKFRFANISTIHGFCSKLIREYPIEANITPDFEIIHELELKLSFTKFIKDQIIEIIQNLSSHPISRKVQNLIKKYDLNKTVGFILELIINDKKFELFYRPIFDRIDNKETYINIIKKRVNEKKISYLKFIIDKETFKQSLNYLLSIDLSPYMPSKSKRGDYSKEIQNFINLLKKLQNNEDLENHNIMLPLEGKWDNKTTSKIFGGEWETLYSNLKTILDILPNKLFELDLQKYNYDGELFELLKDIINLYDYIKEKFEKNHLNDEILRKRRNKALLTFDDLQIITYDLLTNKKHKNRQTEIFNAYEYIMVDECQDIDFIQKQIISLLAFSGKKPANLFIVGDGKQSIYKFRGADVSTFNQLINKIDIRNNINKIEKTNYNLLTNYRSVQAIVNFTNVFFKRLMIDSPEDYDIDYGDNIGTHNEDKEKFPPIEMLLSFENSKEEASEAGNRKKEASMIANRIAQFINGEVYSEKISPGNVAILLRSLNQSHFYERALTERNIKYQVVEGKGFYTRQEIKDCINLLRIIDNERNEIALLSVLRSPFCSIKDKTLFYLTNDVSKISEKAISDENKYNQINLNYGFMNCERFVKDEIELKKLNFLKALLKRLRRNKDKMKISSLLRLALTETAYLSAVIGLPEGKQKKANLEKFMMNINNIEENKNFLLIDLIDYLDNVVDMLASESDAPIPDNKDTITIMTIHKSKGLEFDYVFVPRLDYREKTSYSNILFDIPYSGENAENKNIDKNKELNNSFAFSINYESIDENDKKSFLAYDYLKVIELNKQKSELKRLLYVAFTRAKKHLVASAKISFAKGKDNNLKIRNIIKSPHDDKNLTWLAWYLYLFNINNEDLINLYKNNQTTIDSVGNTYKEYKISNEKIRIIINTKFSKVVKAKFTEQEAKKKITTSIIDISKISKKQLKHISATSLITYNSCPRKYFYKFIKGIKESKEGLGQRKQKYDKNTYNENIVNNPLFEQNEEKTTKNLIPLSMVGNIVHNLLEKYEEKEEFINIVSNEINKQKLSILSDENRKSILINFINNMLTTFVKSDLYQEMLNSRKNFPDSTFNELNFSLNFEDVVIEGAIDKIYKDSNGKLVVMDYKTNSFDKKTNVEKQMIEKAKKYLLQLDVYKLAVSKVLKKQVDTAKLYFLDIQREYTIEPREYNDIEKEVANIISEIKEKMNKGINENTFNVKQSSDCYFCGYWLCEARYQKKAH